MMNRFEITEVKRLYPDDKSQWEPAGHQFGGKRVFADASTAMIARDRAARFYLVSIDHVRLVLMKDPATAGGVLLVVGEMGVVSAKEIDAPKEAKAPPGVAQWPRVTPFRSAFATVVVRANDLSDDELHSALVFFLHRHGIHGQKPKKKKARR